MSNKSTVDVLKWLTFAAALLPKIVELLQELFGEDSPESTPKK